jgi:hypothetical protein
MEANGPNGKASEMKLQITQDLTAGARGKRKLQSYKQEQSNYDGNAYTIGTTYHSDTGTLQLFAMHPKPLVVPNGQLEYHTTQIRSFGMTDLADTFRQGAAAFRNVHDWAKQQRDEFIANANEIAAQIIEEDEEAKSTIQSFAYTDTGPSTSAKDEDDIETSIDELIAGDWLPAKLKSSESQQSHRQKQGRTSLSTRPSSGPQVKVVAEACTTK